MTAKETITGVMLSIALIAVIYEAHRASNSRKFAQALQQQQATLQQQIDEMTRERDQARKELDALREENRTMGLDLAGARKTGQALAQSQGDSQAFAGSGMTNSDNETVALASSWADAVRRLKERFEDTPTAKIPELHLLTPEDWLDVARSANLDTEAGYRRAMADIRKHAEGSFTKKFQAALDIYMSANNGQWPPSLDELTRYFIPPVDDAILQRWEIVSKTAFPGRDFAGDWVLTEKSPVDPGFDWRWTVDGPSSAGVGPYQYSREGEIEALKESLTPVLKAYMAANDGKQPGDPHDLMAYATGPTQATALRYLIQISATNRVAH